MKSEIRRLEQMRGGEKIVPLRRLFNARLHAGKSDAHGEGWKHVSYDACPGTEDPMYTANVYGYDFHQRP